MFRKDHARRDGGGIFSEADSLAEIGSSAFCNNSEDYIIGPWHDLGQNEFSDYCDDTFEAWLHEHFDEPQREDESVSGFFANPSGDGIPNLLKYALGLDPWQTYPNATPPPAVQTFPDEGTEEYLTFSFSHPSGLSDIEYHVQLSSDLADWSEPAAFVSSKDNGTLTTRTYRDTASFDASNRRFMRLEVSRQ